MNYIWGAVGLVLFGAGWWVGGMSDRLACAESRIETYKTNERVIAAEIKRADEAESKLAKALAKSPQTGKKVADAVRNNPAPVNCVVPDAVVDSLQAGIDSGKSAAR